MKEKSFPKYFHQIMIKDLDLERNQQRFVELIRKISSIQEANRASFYQNSGRSFLECSTKFLDDRRESFYKKNGIKSRNKNQQTKNLKTKI